MAEETFLPIAGWECLYEVSNLGRVRSLPRVVRHQDGTVQSFKGGIMTPTKMTGGYVCARLSDAANGRGDAPLFTDCSPRLLSRIRQACRRLIT
jgi:hypothetical protein